MDKRRRRLAEMAARVRDAEPDSHRAALVEPGMRILDLASGSGEPAVSLAVAAGPEGQVIATDIVSLDLLAMA